MMSLIHPSVYPVSWDLNYRTSCSVPILFARRDPTCHIDGPFNLSLKLVRTAPRVPGHKGQRTKNATQTKRHDSHRERDPDVLKINTIVLPLILATKWYHTFHTYSLYIICAHNMSGYTLVTLLFIPV